MAFGQDSLNTRRQLQGGAHAYHYYSLNTLLEQGYSDIKRLSYSLKVLLEN